MLVLRASHLGMCFGVRDALALARGIAAPADVTIHGELVHNPQVNEDLARRGFRRTPESARDTLPETPRVMITAHGISDRERARLTAAGKQLIDTTCPLVRRVHEAARMLADHDYFVVVIGRRDHVEVRGIVGDLAHCTVVESAADVRAFDAARIGVVCQTTTRPVDAGLIRKAIEDANPGRDIRFVDTICAPTRDHQRATHELLPQVDALVVVGGRHSNNTRQLGQLAEAHAVPWLLVERPEDLDLAWFAPFRAVGLTAGTSTPDDVIDAVQRALMDLRPARVSA